MRAMEYSWDLKKCPILNKRNFILPIFILNLGKFILPIALLNTDRKIDVRAPIFSQILNNVSNITKLHICFSGKVMKL